jgi:hypothetical protein
MNCDFLDRLLEQADSPSLEQVRALRTHLTQCPECRQRLERDSASEPGDRGSASEDLSSHPTAEELTELVLPSSSPPAAGADWSRIWRHVLLCDSCLAELQTLREAQTALAEGRHERTTLSAARIWSEWRKKDRAPVLAAWVGERLVLRERLGQTSFTPQPGATSGYLWTAGGYTFASEAGQEVIEEERLLGGIGVHIRLQAESGAGRHLARIEVALPPGAAGSEEPDHSLVRTRGGRGEGAGPNYSLVLTRGGRVEETVPLGAAPAVLGAQPPGRYLLSLYDAGQLLGDLELEIVDDL